MSNGADDARSGNEPFLQSEEEEEDDDDKDRVSSREVSVHNEIRFFSF